MKFLGIKDLKLTFPYISSFCFSVGSLLCVCVPLYVIMACECTEAQAITEKHPIYGAVRENPAERGNICTFYLHICTRSHTHLNILPFQFALNLLFRITREFHFFSWLPWFSSVSFPQGPVGYASISFLLSQSSLSWMFTFFFFPPEIDYISQTVSLLLILSIRHSKTLRCYCPADNTAVHT